MALPLLVNGGADCGPINPLRGIMKQFDSERGIQQDQFGIGRAGPSHQTFRSAQTPDAALQEETARFFGSARASPVPHVTFPVNFEIGHPQPSFSTTLAPQSKGWASDFLTKQSPQSVTLRGRSIPTGDFTQDFIRDGRMVQPQGSQSTTPQRVQSPLAFAPMSSARHFQPMLPLQHAQRQVSIANDEAITHAIQRLELEEQASQKGREIMESREDMDELSRTARLLIDSVKDEQNPKFRDSSFMSLMRQLRDREMVVEGNDLTGASDSQWASEFAVSDLKGKGKASGEPLASTVRRKSVHFDSQPDIIVEDPRAVINTTSQEEELDDYFRQENHELRTIWSEHDATLHASRVHGAVEPQATTWTAQKAEWNTLQEDWERFEATANGIKQVNAYPFNANNPYLLGDSSTTRHHSFHETRASESVLQKEAAVQRDPLNAQSWFELGVKQQENEREGKAIQALSRAVELDPSLLNAWLALAISYTNENQRSGAYDSIEQWVHRNTRYDSVTSEFKQRTKESTQSNKYEELLHSLVAMIQSVPGGEVDADTQIALAVLLNTTEDYARARDCFKSALDVRPDDWLLYNRVGATLANSGNASEAVNYYYRALELNPGYIRARFNLGISCINLRRYTEAAQHILDALVLQEIDNVDGPEGNTRGVTSSALWDSLKTTCLHLQRMDLAMLCDEGDLAGIRNALTV